MKLAPWLILLVLPLLAAASDPPLAHRFQRFVKRNAMRRACPAKNNAQVPPPPTAGTTTSPPTAEAPAPTAGQGAASPPSPPPSTGNGTTTPGEADGVQPPATGASASPFQGKAKRGLGFQRPQDTHLFPKAGNWGYSWNDGELEGNKPGESPSICGSAPPSRQTRAGMVYIPMLWGSSEDKTRSWMANAQAAIDAGAPASVTSLRAADRTTEALTQPARLQ
jgi:hypothetical protein